MSLSFDHSIKTCLSVIYKIFRLGESFTLWIRWFRLCHILLSLRDGIQLEHFTSALSRWIWLIIYFKLRILVIESNQIRWKRILLLKANFEWESNEWCIAFNLMGHNLWSIRQTTTTGLGSDKDCSSAILKLEPVISKHSASAPFDLVLMKLSQLSTFIKKAHYQNFSSSIQINQFLCNLTCRLHQKILSLQNITPLLKLWSIQIFSKQRLQCLSWFKKAHIQTKLWEDSSLTFENTGHQTMMKLSLLQ